MASEIVFGAALTFALGLLSAAVLALFRLSTTVTKMSVSFDTFEDKVAERLAENRDEHQQLREQHGELRQLQIESARTNMQLTNAINSTSEKLLEHARHEEDLMEQNRKLMSLVIAERKSATGS